MLPASAESPDRPNRVPWPPLIYLAVFAAAFLLEHFIPQLPAWPDSFFLRWLGSALVLTGIGLAILGILQFRADETTFHPTHAADNLAVNGIYRYTRNPMYLGAMVAFFGGALAARSPWLLVLLPPTAYALTRLAIEPEEAYLERRFGDAYRDYKSRTRRWI